ncbi:hypothetical protein GHYDROH2_24160 [Geobacter hydrogenophilus]|uniref:Uncharacterized protein n=2 Tax=Geobacter hydrogenophilus TaxID=40983 RepID=A0A9W6G150_9BACT|nr:hypothetical protein GHYDROH2_24160 [Geobacter hydrogenophilus]
MSFKNITLPSGSYLCSYRQLDIGNKRIDPLLHASCYYALFNKCIDVGNYEAYYDLFPVHFRKDAAILPSADEVTYQPYNIDWIKYPAINYIIGWNINNRDNDKLFFLYSTVKNFKNLTIWKRKRFKDTLT